MAYRVEQNPAVCLRSFNRCAELVAEHAALAGGVARFGKNFSYYKKLFFAWQEYRLSNIKEDFFNWFSNHLQRWF